MNEVTKNHPVRKVLTYARQNALKRRIIGAYKTEETITIMWNIGPNSVFRGRPSQINKLLNQALRGKGLIIDINIRQFMELWNT